MIYLPLAPLPRAQRPTSAPAPFEGRARRRSTWSRWPRRRDCTEDDEQHTGRRESRRQVIIPAHVLSRALSRSYGGVLRADLLPVIDTLFPVPAAVSVCRQNRSLLSVRRFERGSGGGAAKGEARVFPRDAVCHFRSIRFFLWAERRNAPVVRGSKNLRGRRPRRQHRWGIGRGRFSFACAEE